MTAPLVIGSRDSALAQWQAKEVQQLLQQESISSEIKWIKSIGDLVQDRPLQAIGTVGVFTKALDEALINNEIDLAVHSCKDLPSVLDERLTICAYLPREEFDDVIVGNSEIDFFDKPGFNGTIATGSVRRKAQILAQFPNAKVVGLRGNVPTRLKKLKDNGWDGAVFALAGLKRLGVTPKFYKKADFMLPAPAQGVVAIVCRKDDERTLNACRQINDKQTELTTRIEREFLRLMEGGCISPIAANAVIVDDQLSVKVSVLSVNGDEKIEAAEVCSINQSWNEIAMKLFNKVKSLGAVELIKRIEQNA